MRTVTTQENEKVAASYGSSSKADILVSVANVAFCFSVAIGAFWVLKLRDVPRLFVIACATVKPRGFCA